MDNELSKIIGQRINTLLSRNNVKQKDLAEYLGVPDNTISYFCNGKRIPNTEQIKKIAQWECFNTSADYLLGITEVASADKEKEIDFISKYTGLSEKAIDVLHYYHGCEMIYPTINLLLESEISSALQELGYVVSDMPKDVLKEKCKENDIDYDSLENVIETKSYECLQVVSTIEQYLNLRKPKIDKRLSISQSGNIISLSETYPEYSKHLNIDDFYTIKVVNQSEIVEKVVLDNVVEALKKLKKESANNANNPKA